MNFDEPEDFAVIRSEVRRLCDKYGNEYWRSLEPDRYPEAFVADLTAAIVDAPDEAAADGGE